jgi:putative oxygen-independent coproporphyrinogen III oxidase
LSQQTPALSPAKIASKETEPSHSRHLKLPPLSLYVHIPWCEQKCPYCDFNSHNLKGELPESEYISHLLNDLEQDLPLITTNGNMREVSSIFIGGGTPSLLSVLGMQKLLSGIRARIPLTIDVEITMEANPGSVEANKFIGFESAGINRISLGVQSFNTEHLKTLGRIHDSTQAKSAVELANLLPLRSFNLDLMHGLPDQSVEDAMLDLEKAIALEPPHLSWYQLTIEPNTSFYSKPPRLPDDDILWEIQERGHQLLINAGYQQYEISAYSKSGHQCQHNLNYWRFGDYLGIGCGAHGKITLADQNKIIRTEKVKHPKGYMDLIRPYMYKTTKVIDTDLAFEFFMNRFRIMESCPKQDFVDYAGRALSYEEKQNLDKAISMDLIVDQKEAWQLTDTGKRYLNSLLDLFV